ncbi:carboxypeptidase regulatory-like domain-containing protein [Corynebacterium pilbarense]
MDENGKGVANAKVQVDGVSATTDDKGYFELVGVPAGRQSLTIQETAQTKTQQGISVEISETPRQDLGSFEVVEKLGSVSGSVKDQDGDPVKGAKVVIDDGKGNRVETTTDDNGNVNVDKLPAGDYTVTVEADGYSKGESKVRVNPGESASFPEVRVKQLPGSVSGSVKDQDGDPVKGAKVVIDDGKGNRVETTTDDNGKVNVDKLPAGDYTVTVEADGYSKGESKVTVNPGESASFPEVRVKQLPGSVSGSVKDQDGNPVEGATVVIDDGKGNRFEVPTDRSGNVDVQDVPAGDYTVTVTADGYNGGSTSVTVKPDEAATIPEVRLQEKPQPTTTTKPTTSAPKPTTSKPTTSKPTTSAAKPTTSAAKPTTSAAKPTTSAAKPTAAPAPTTDSKPEPKKPSIVGTVTDPEGNPLPPTKDKDGKPQPPTVTVKDQDGNQVGDPIEVDENGNFEVPELPKDGDYVVIVDAPDGFNDPKPQVVPVKKGETSKLPPIKVDKPEIELDKNKPAAKPGSVHGWLVDESNRPITGSDIKLVKKGVTDPETGETFDYEVPIKVDADGYFVTPPIDFKYFPEGKADFDLEVTLPEGWPDEDINGDKINRTVTVKAGKSTPVEIKVEAPKTQSIVGRVDDGNGKAVPGTTVVVTDPRGNSRVIPVEDDGTFEVDDVIPGVHDVEILTPGRGNDVDRIKVPVRTGEKVELPEIHLTTNKSLKLEKRVWGRDADNNGKVKNEDGELVDDVMTVKDGEDLIYALIVTNDGDEPIKDIEFDDPELEKRNIELTMPEGWTAESELAPGESKVWSAKMKAPEDAFDFNNVATANGVTSKGEKVGSLPDSAYTKFLRGAVDKKVNARFATNKDKPVKAEANSPLGFTYEVKNTGSTAMVNVKLTDIVYEDGVDEDKCKPVKASEKTEGNQCYDLDVKAPEGFTGTLLPGERVVFTAELPEGLKEGAKHHNAAEARGELPARPGRGGDYDGEPNYGDDPSSVLIISPKDNIKGNAHVVVSEGAELDSSDLRVVAWVDENANGKQDPDEALTGLKLTLVPSDGTPSFAGNADENGNVLFEGTPYGKYTVKIDSPGELRLVDPKDPENNSFDPGAVLESKEFEVNKDEQYISLQLETPRTVGISEGGAGQAQGEEEGSSLGKCLASASSVSNPVAWLVPLGLLGAVMGGIGVMFEDELNQISAQANAALREVMPETNFGSGFNFERPQWMNDIQAQIDGVNRQLAEINPAAPAAAGGVALLAIAGLLTGLYYASCELGWAEPKEGSSSEAEGSSSEGSSSKEAEAEAESEAQPEEAAN